MNAPTSIVIRRPSPAKFAAEATATAALYLASRRATLPGLREPHTDAETRVWMRDTVFERHSVRVAEVEGEIVGFASRDGAWLMNLYIKPSWTGRGIGSKLLDAMLAEAAAVTPVLRLYTFARNQGARRFYERHGFTAVMFGDGSANAEGEADVRYERALRG
jgi:GNAT superfamily N-acetyltransferase